jgi:O-methyltransferase
MGLLRKILEKTGTLSTAERAMRFMDKRTVPVPSMQFPTFNAVQHDLISSENDYVRYAILGLAVQRILSENIEGDFAEVGVYRGDMSKFIHGLAPNRPYFLFDTFEGFPAKDLEEGVIDSRFSDTSEQAVLKNIGDTSNVIVRKGYVPETLVGLEDHRFSFVLLDLDLYNPTLKSLEFFYQRLSSGGYMVVHDYNSPESNWACKRAVDEFMADKPEGIVEIADEWGSILFRKVSGASH